MSSYHSLWRHRKKDGSTLTFPFSRGSLKRQNIVPEFLDWEMRDDDSNDENLDDQVTSDEENSEVNINDIKKDFGLWLKKLEKLTDSPHRWKGNGIRPSKFQVV